jgi:hypothetical protein
VRCPDAQAAEQMYALIDAVRRRGDSIGGVVECVARGVPAGLGEPVFDKLEADLAKALISLPAAKGFEVGSGFAGTALTGSEHNDPFTTDAQGRTRTTTNRSGGIQAASATASRSCCASPSSRRRPSASPSRPSTGAGSPSCSRPAGATTPACCRGPSRWSRRWSASRSRTTGCASAPSTSLPAPTR